MNVNDTEIAWSIWQKKGEGDLPQGGCGHSTSQHFHCSHKPWGPYPGKGMISQVSHQGNTPLFVKDLETEM